MFPSGHIVLKHYRIDRLIGVGGMGLIFRAMDTRDGHLVAIKVLRPTPDQNEKDVLRFHREAHLLSQLSHAHVLDVMEVGTLENGIPVLVMELLEGRDLRQEIRVRERFPVEEAVGYVMQAAAAAGAVHAAGMVHRDIKPQNLFITNLGGARHLKLLDFGISKSTEGNEATLTATQGTLGTPQYMSPEQIFGARDVDARSDIWALGVILYFLLAGRLPFTGPTPGAIIAQIPNTEPPPLGSFRTDLPREIITIAERCLRKNPKERFASAEELRLALLPFGPPDDVIIAPVVDVPSTIPPVSMKDRFGYMASLPQTSAVPSWILDKTEGMPEGTPALELEPARSPASVPTVIRGAERQTRSQRLNLSVPADIRMGEQKGDFEEVTVPSSRKRGGFSPGNSSNKQQLLFFLVGGLGAILIAYFTIRAGTSASQKESNVTLEFAEPSEAPMGVAASRSDEEPSQMADSVTIEPIENTAKPELDPPSGSVGEEEPAQTLPPKNSGNTASQNPKKDPPASSAQPAPSAPAQKKPDAPPLFL